MSLQEAIIESLRNPGSWNDDNWRERGLCFDSAWEPFFPERGETTSKAKEICYRCPVQVDCLTYAIHTRNGFGVWGGMSVRERAALAREAGLPAPNRMTSAAW